MDGGFEVFLLLMFVFWILEGIAKARRPRVPPLPDQVETTPTAEERTTAERVPSTTAEPAKRPADRGQRSPTLMEILSAELERAKETHRQMEEAQRAERRDSAERRASVTREPARAEWHPPTVGRPTKPQPPRKRDRAIPRRPPLRGADSPRQALRPATRSSSAELTDFIPGQSRKSAAVLRGERDVVEQFSEREREERTSDAWASGERDAERGSTREAERLAAIEVERSASLEAAPRRAKLQRAGIKESQQPLQVTKRAASRPAGRSLDPRHLIDASTAELRRILVLQEVLGPPVGLRDER